VLVRHFTTLSPNIDNVCSRLTLAPYHPHEPLDCLPL
jgi:hypothetical protein